MMISEGKADLGGRFGYCGFYCMKILACNGLSCKSCMGPEGLEGLTCWETISCRLGFKLVAFLFQPEGIFTDGFFGGPPWVFTAGEWLFVEPP